MGNKEAQLIRGQGLFVNGCKRKFESDSGNLVSGVSPSLKLTSPLCRKMEQREALFTFYLLFNQYRAFACASYAVTIIKIQLYRSKQNEINRYIYIGILATRTILLPVSSVTKDEGVEG